MHPHCTGQGPRRVPLPRPLSAADQTSLTPRDPPPQSAQSGSFLLDPPGLAGFSMWAGSSVPPSLTHSFDLLIHPQTLQTHTTLLKPTASQQRHWESNSYYNWTPDSTLLHSITIPRLSETVHPSSCSPSIPAYSQAESQQSTLPPLPGTTQCSSTASPLHCLLHWSCQTNTRQSEGGFTRPPPCHHLSVQNAQGPLHLTSCPPSPCPMPSGFLAGPWQATFNLPTLQLGAGRTACL